MSKQTLKRGTGGMMLALAALSGVSSQAAEIEEIVITSAMLEETIPQDLSRYGSRVEVISGEQLQEGGYVDVTQALQMLVPGLHIRPKNGQFDYFDASLQGSRSSEILWLIDGVRITNRLYNGTSPLDTIPAHMVERIEVLKGGQGIYYGTQSVGGVVNIVTRGFRTSQDAALSAGVNSNQGYSVNGYYRDGNERHQWVAYASRDQADGYQPWRDSALQPSATDRERGFEVDMAGFKYAWHPGERSRLSLQYQRTENELDFARPYLNRSTVNAREEDIVTLKYDWQPSDSVGLFVKLYQHNWDTEYTRIYNELDAQGNLTGGTRVINDASYWGYEDHGANAMARMDFGHGLEYVVGLDHQNFSGVDEVWRIGDQEEEVNAVFGQVRSTEELFPDTMLALGLRRNEPSNSEASTVWNFSAKHFFTQQLYARANIGTSFRLPDAEALFLNEYYDDDNDGVPDGGWFAVGNPELKPEKSRNLNLAVGWNNESLSLELVGFDRRITDYIASYVPLTIAGVVGESFINSDDEVEVRGLELLGSWSVNQALSLTASYNRTASELNGDGVQLTGIPESELKLAARYEPQGLPVGLTLSLNHVGELNARRGQERGNYTVMDASAWYRFGPDDRHSLNLRLENLSDKVYATRVDRGTLDATGESYLYDNLGMRRTLHASYRYQF